MQKVSSRNLRSGPEEGKHLPFDPTLTKMTAWLTSLPAFQISPLSLRSGREIQESLQLFRHSRTRHSSLPGHLKRSDSSRVCTSPEALETCEPLSLRMFAYRSDSSVTAPTSCGTQRDNQRELDARAQRTYIHGDSSNRMSSYTCVTTCCGARSSLRIWVAVPSCRNGVAIPSKTSITASPTRHRSIRAPPKKGREKTLVDPDVHTAFTRRANSVLVLVLRERQIDGGGKARSLMHPVACVGCSRTQKAAPVSLWSIPREGPHGRPFG
jgi:hypothetical protein